MPAPSFILWLNWSSGFAAVIYQLRVSPNLCKHGHIFTSTLCTVCSKNQLCWHHDHQPAGEQGGESNRSHGDVHVRAFQERLLLLWICTHHQGSAPLSPLTGSTILKWLHILASSIPLIEKKNAFSVTYSICLLCEMFISFHLQPAAKTFGKSPVDRHLSLQERKEALYNFARRWEMSLLVTVSP